MKEINNVKYFDIVDICEIFHNKISEEELRNYFEEEKIKGKKIEENWYTTEDELKKFVNQILLKEKAVMVGPHKIDLSNIKLEGRVLDIGGGGEGIIGQVGGEQVVAIDFNKSELEEAPDSGELKIIMNAKELKFLDNTFDIATTFFTLMYIPLNDHKKIFQEIHRVLKPNGVFLLWDLYFPKKINKEKEFYGVTLRIKINEITIETGYVVKWVKEQDINYYLDLGKNIGFDTIETKIKEDTFYIKFRKD
ncbi:MAG: class I SAM-dependent methyltransferase [Candidatus Hodarchaeota archaeon]